MYELAESNFAEFNKIAACAKCLNIEKRLLLKRTVFEIIVQELCRGWLTASIAFVYTLLIFL